MANPKTQIGIYLKNPNSDKPQKLNCDKTPKLNCDKAKKKNIMTKIIFYLNLSGDLVSPVCGIFSLFPKKNKKINKEL